MSDRWMSVEEIADYLGVSKDTIYGWITKRGMPAHKVGSSSHAKWANIRLYPSKSDQTRFTRAGFGGIVLPSTSAGEGAIHV